MITADDKHRDTSSTTYDEMLFAVGLPKQNNLFDSTLV